MGPDGPGSATARDADAAPPVASNAGPHLSASGFLVRARTLRVIRNRYSRLEGHLSEEACTPKVEHSAALASGDELPLVEVERAGAVTGRRPRRDNQRGRVRPAD